MDDETTSPLADPTVNESRIVRKLIACSHLVDAVVKLRRRLKRQASDVLLKKEDAHQNKPSERYFLAL